MTKKISKRTFLKNMGAVFGLFVSPQVLALAQLQQMPDPTPNKFQTDLIKNPKKQILIAEIADCVGYPPYPNPGKLKCLSNNS